MLTKAERDLIQHVFDEIILYWISEDAMQFLDTEEKRRFHLDKIKQARALRDKIEKL